MPELHLEPDEYTGIMAMGQTFGALGDVMCEGGGSPEALRMIVSSLRSSADLLERVLERWEQS